MSTTNTPAWCTTLRLLGRISSVFREAIFVERHRRVEHLHAELAFRRNRELDRHLEDVVGLAAGRPAFGELRHRRQVGVVALWRAAVHPGDDGVDLLLRQAAIVAHLEAVVGVGAPGRHLARHDLAANHLRPGPDVFVGEKSHRRHFTRAVARRALVEHDRRDVFRKRGDAAGGPRGGLNRGDREHRNGHRGKDGDDTFHDPS
jgi:hypothetical protein